MFYLFLGMKIKIGQRYLLHRLLMLMLYDCCIRKGICMNVFSFFFLLYYTFSLTLTIYQIIHLRKCHAIYVFALLRLHQMYHAFHLLTCLIRCYLMFCFCRENISYKFTQVISVSGCGQSVMCFLC